MNAHKCKYKHHVLQQHECLHKLCGATTRMIIQTMWCHNVDVCTYPVVQELNAHTNHMMLQHKCIQTSCGATIKTFTHTVQCYNVNVRTHHVASRCSPTEHCLFCADNMLIMLLFPVPGKPAELIQSLHCQ